MSSDTAPMYDIEIIDRCIKYELKIKKPLPYDTHSTFYILYKNISTEENNILKDAGDPVAGHQLCYSSMEAVSEYSSKIISFMADRKKNIKNGIVENTTANNTANNTTVNTTTTPQKEKKKTWDVFNLF